MWVRSELKKKAKSSLKRNYWYSIAVCFIIAILVGQYPVSTVLIHQYSDKAEIQSGVIIREKGTTNSDIVNNYIFQFSDPETRVIVENDANSSSGVLGTVFNNITQSNSFIFGILNSINQAFFQDKIGAGITIFIGALINISIVLFVCNLLRVGECRFFLENRVYSKTKISRIFYLYKIRKIWNPVKIMFFQSLYLGLWCLTIVGVIIKSYSYRMIPYIVAENPQISKKEAFALSRKMMDGNKWRTFVLDISFFWWSCLEVITLGLLGIFFINAYRTSTNAELYMNLRNYAKENNFEYSESLNDNYLVAAPTECETSTEK